MNIIVTSKDDVVAAYFKHETTHILTILDHDEEFILPSYVSQENWKRFNCSDTHDLDNSKVPTKKLVKEILDWAKELPEDANLLVHCFAGISRSTSIAMAIMIQKYGVRAIDHAIDHVSSMRRVCAPNKLITQYADEILGCNGELHFKAQSRVKYVNLMELANAKEVG
jgi:predicted protein tyrosine phosphatase